VDIATAAVKLLHAAEHSGEEEVEIPVVQPPGERQKQRRERLEGDRGERVRSARDDAPRASAKKKPRGRKPGFEVTRLFVGAGRKVGVRPTDIVGAIANEAGIDARTIGSIEIADRFSLVEVPEDAADDIIAALGASTIKGKRVVVRRDRS
jgi:ATP-dependent RNA helicase DeaD